MEHRAMKTARFLLAAWTAATVPAFAGTTPAIAAFEQAFAKVDDYTVTVHAHEMKGNRIQDRTYRYSFKRPNMVKADIIAGDGSGNGGVWRGGNLVNGHIRIAFITVHKTVDVHDGRATSLRGYTIPEGLLQNQIEKYVKTGGRLVQRDGPVLDGVATDEVELTIDDPAANDNITRAVLYLSKSTHFPVRQVRYEGNKMVADETFIDLKTNVGLRDSDFPF
jgi:outer membrane lipoprotein-sorting protein